MFIVYLALSSCLGDPLRSRSSTRTAPRTFSGGSGRAAREDDGMRDVLYEQLRGVPGAAWEHIEMENMMSMETNRDGQHEEY